MRTSLLALVALTLVSHAVPVSAHHAFAAEFDANKPIKLKGTVTKMLWINPHPWIHIAVKKDDGTVEQWMIEASAPNSLLRRGFNRDSLPMGSVITVDGYQALDGSKRANGTSLTWEDGRHLFIGSSGIGAPYEKLVPPGEKK